MVRTAEQLHRSAVELSIRGRWPGARRDLERARARTPDPDLQARIDATGAYILQRTGRPDDAERECREVLARPGLSPHTRAIVRGQLGSLAAHAGRLDEAERLLSTAIAGLADDPVAAARLRMNRSLVRTSRRQLVAATADLEAAAKTFGDHHLDVDAAHARHNLGYSALLAGDLVSALEEMLAARPIAASSPVAGAICDEDRAEVLRDAGLTTEAEAILARASAVFAAHGMPQSRAEADLQLAQSRLTHDLAGARRAAVSATRTFRALGNQPWAARADAIRLRAELGEGTMDLYAVAMPAPRRPPQEAEIAEAAAGLERHGFTDDAAALRITHELWRARRAPAEMSASVLRTAPGATVHVRLLAHTLRAERAASRGRWSESRRHAARGLDALSDWHHGFGSLDLQTSLSMHGSELVYAGLTAAVRSGRPDVIFEWSERARRLSIEVAPLRPPPDPELASELAELRMLRADRGVDWLADPRAAELRERARQRQWSGTGASTGDRRATLDEAQQTLDGGTAIVSFVVSRDGLLALVTTDGDAVVVPITDAEAVRRAMPGLRADLDMAAAVRSGPLVTVVRSSLERRLAAVSDALLGDVLAIAGDRRLVVTAPGVLAGLPWAMLPALRGRVFTLATSATDWAAQSRRRRAPLASAGFVLGPRVARGGEEVAAAAAAWSGPTVLSGEAATTAATAALAERVDVLHVAAHGRHAVDNPLFSGLELADGALFGYDVDLVPQVPGVVVLSSCEVGRSSVRGGEEAIGMTRVWLHAGTRCVVATPVVVADDDACELLGAMHADLAAGAEPAAALAAASARTGIVSSFQAHGNGF